MGKTLAIIFSALLLAGLVLFFFNTSIVQNDGNFVYPLDDAYIHMAMAKNLAFEGQWGVTRHEFSSASSSILYTLLNALTFKLFGITEYGPLLLNMGAGFLIFFALWKIFGHEKINFLAVLIFCLLAIFLTPLPSLILSGMEHTLQILINLVFIYKAARYLEDNSKDNKSFLQLALLGAFAVAIRFEGIFIVAVVSGLLFLKKDFSKGILLGLIAIVPVVVFGIISIQNGSYFIPNSLLMKGEKPKMNLIGLVQYAFLWLDKLKRNPHMLVIFFWLILNFLYQRKSNLSIWHRSSLFSIIVGLTIIIHLTFAKTGWFYRYEAYLVFLGLFSFIWVLQEGLHRFSYQLNRVPGYIGMLFLFMTSLYPLHARGKDAILDILPASKNIYEQQYQMARFVEKYYPKASICANDIGAMCFFSDIKLFDMFGLASKDIINLRIKGKFDKENIHKLAQERAVDIVIIYDYWFIGKVPDQWIKAGEWEVENNVILGGSVVSFFATERYDVEKLKTNLRNFSSELPAGVTESGAYMLK